MKKISDNQTGDYFFRALLEIHKNDANSNRHKLFSYRSLFNEFLRFLTKDEFRFFSSNFARFVFIRDKFDIQKELDDELGRMRKMFSFWLTGIKRDVPVNVPLFSASALIKLFKSFLEVDLNDDLNQIIAQSQKAIPQIPEKKGESLDQLKVSVTDIKGDLIYAETENSEKVCINLKNKWKQQFHLIQKSSVLNLVDFEVQRKADMLYLTNKDSSILVLEPDYLLDVTDISSSYYNNQPEPAIYFLKKLTGGGISDAMLLGNIINSLFDELLTNPEADFSESYRKAISYKPLSIFALAVTDKEKIGIIKEKAEWHFKNIRNLLPHILDGKISIEPSFISPKFGLQGRLDVLTEYSDDKRRKNIIELKSGKSARQDLSISLPGGKKVRTGIWNEHYAQTILYNMILDSTYENRSGSTQIFYSADSIAPLRDAPNIVTKKQEVSYLRNLIVAEELKIAGGSYDMIYRINPESFASAQDFIKKDLTAFSNTFGKLDMIEKKYYLNNISFCLSEMLAAKLGSDNGRNAGASSLWLDSLEDKSASFNIAAGLHLNYGESDFDRMYLVLDRSGNYANSFRTGDFCIIYPYDPSDESKIFNDQLIKCHIVEINADFIRISLRNKQISREYFQQWEAWNLEPDTIETTSKLMQSFSGFLCADEAKRKVLLGIKQAEFSAKPAIKSEILNERQNHILCQALSAKDYFIIQGPPGTGKTSYMLKELVNYISQSTAENILILAYTNRAVDEICSAVKSIDPHLQCLRMGNKESSEHSDVLISALAEKKDFGELYKLILKTRIFISTVSTAITNPELFIIKNFDTAIVDEASQILEPYLSGILMKVKRFILIGDEKQLPAIVLQNEYKLAIHDPSLNNLEMRMNGQSLFERLLRICKANKWYDSFNLLNEQARMHKDILAIINNLFYSEELKPAFEWQSDKGNIYEGDSDNELEHLLLSKRTVFIPVKPENKNKINKYEIEMVMKIVSFIHSRLKSNFNASSIGIISPFRAQVSEINKTLPTELRDLITVDTVERFQGSERDTIIISLALNNSYLLKSIQSLTEIEGTIVDRKLNVAITRARKQFIILGTPHLLGESPVFSKLMHLIKESGGFFSGYL